MKEAPMEETKAQIKVRDLNTGDLFTVLKIASKMSKKSASSLAEMVKDPNKSDPTVAGIMMTLGGFSEIEEDVKLWMAGLIGKSKEEFSKMPLTTTLDILDQLSHQEGITSFLSRLAALWKVMGRGSSIRSEIVSKPDTAGQTNT
jgi:hypothetical protein